MIDALYHLYCTHAPGAPHGPQIHAWPHAAKRILEIWACLAVFGAIAEHPQLNQHCACLSWNLKRIPECHGMMTLKTQAEH